MENAHGIVDSSAAVSYTHLDVYKRQVIERGLFDYLYRLVTTDIKPPVFYRICENEKDYKELTE